LPPGDYADTLMDALIQEGGDMNKEYVEAIRKTYGLDEPMIGRYFNWFFNLFRGNWGYSFATSSPVTEMIMKRLPLSISIDLTIFAFVWIVSVPIGIYSAVRQYSFGDYVATVIGFIGFGGSQFSACSSHYVDRFFKIRCHS
jgi:peptide/nickel transport system permease protein